MTNEASPPAALDLSEADFHLFLERTPDIVFVQRGGTIIYVNAAFVKAMRGAEAKTFTGLKLIEIIAPDDRERIAAQLRDPDPRAVRNAQDVRCIRADRTIATWQYAGFRVGDPAQPTTILMCRDVTDLRNQAESLRRTEEEFRSVFEGAPIGVTLTSLSGKYLRANRAMCNLVGYSEEELRQRTFFDLTRPDYRAPDVEVIRNLRIGLLQQANFRKVYLHKSGRELDISISVSLVRGGNGQPIGYVSHIIDISESLRAADARRQVVELLRAIAAAANEATSSDIAIEKSLALVAKFAGWSVGHALDLQGGELVSRGIWYLRDPIALERFREEVQQFRFKPGAGLPGRALVSKSPSWKETQTDDPEFPRAPIARRYGLMSGIAFPVLAGEEVIMVMEFFSERVEAPTEEIAGLMANVGIQLGRVVERERYEQEVRALSLTDDLTGLNNRRGFMVLAGQQLRALARTRRAAAVLFADLDGLKLINDELGHDAGDEALASFGRLLRRTFREGDIISRFGGDEFVIFMDSPAVMIDAALLRLAQNLRDANLQRPVKARLAASIGVVEVKPESGEPLESVVARADAVMYENKRAKRAASA